MSVRKNSSIVTSGSVGLDVGEAKIDVSKSLTKSKTLVGSADFASPVEADAALKQQAKYVCI
jgi:hypothetical protein